MSFLFPCNAQNFQTPQKQENKKTFLYQTLCFSQTLQPNNMRYLKETKQNVRLDQFASRAKSRKEVATEYQISTRTLHRWLRSSGMGKLPPKLLRPRDLTLIYRKFGLPEKTIEEIIR